jgi:hypothetical protein
MSDELIEYYAEITNSTFDEVADKFSKLKNMPNKKFHTFYTRSGIKVAIPLELWNEVENEV